jgi:hypothetical protein
MIAQLSREDVKDALLLFVEVFWFGLRVRLYLQRELSHFTCYNLNFEISKDES